MVAAAAAVGLSDCAWWGIILIIGIIIGIGRVRARAFSGTISALLTWDD